MESAKWPPIDWLWLCHRLNSAWYSGDPERLRRDTAGFWKTDERHKLHVPIAAELAALAAGLLFSGSPTATHPDKATNDRLQKLSQSAGLYQRLLHAAELQSVYGGVFLKLNWDKELADYPLISVVPGNAGLPTYQNGVLVDVKIWSDVKKDESNSSIWRLEEAYSRDGHIRSTLYKGDAENLGQPVPLNSIIETRGTIPDANSGTNKLLAVYVPNRLPNRLHPFSRYGSSDFEGLYGLFSALDEAYSSLMRDVRHCKSQIIVPVEYLRKREDIRQWLDGEDTRRVWTFDTSNEVFTALDMSPEQHGTEIKHVQPNLRADDHAAVVNDLIRRIYMMAGYSPQSAGLDIDGRAESGTALNVRERRSMQTAETKKTYWWHALVAFLDAMLALDAAVFRSGAKADGNLSLTFADNTQPDMLTIADTLDKLERAGAVSIDTKVRMAHPDWTDDKIAAEIARIKNETGVLDGTEPPDTELGDTEARSPLEDDPGGDA